MAKNISACARRVLALSPEELEKRVEVYLTQMGLTRDNVIPVEAMRKVDGRLYYDLGIYALQEEKIQAAGRGLRLLGYNTREHSTSPKMSEQEIVDALGDVFSYKVAEQAYKGKLGKKGNLKKRIYDHPDRRARRAYLACFAQQRADFEEGRLVRIINGLHPTLARRYGRPLYDVLTNPPYSRTEVGATLEELFYEGADISAIGLRRHGEIGNKVVYAVRYDPLPEEDERQLDLFRRRKTRKDARTFDHNVARLMGLDFLGPPWLGPDIESRVNVALIQERQLLFLFHILARYDPNLTKSGCGQAMRKYIPTPLEKVYTACRGADVQLKNGKGEPPEADGRVVAGGIESLLEVKGHRYISSRQVDAMLRKYQRKLVWSDGKKVQYKLLLLNSLFSSDQQRKAITEKCEKEKWKVMTGDSFLEMYVQGINLLLHDDPTFFEHLTIPLRDPTALVYLAEEVYQRPHLRMRLGRRKETEWFAELLHTAILSLAGEKTMGPGEVYAGEQQIIVPLASFQEIYGHDLGEINVEDCLFLDLETSAFKGQGGPIFLLGMAYTEKSKMVLEVDAVREPNEERQVVQRFLEVAARYTSEKKGRIVTFNGKSFDLPYLVDRCLAHCLRFKPEDFEHVDLLHRYREEKHYPRMTLQTYERVDLGIRRSGDIPGRLIPEAFRDMIYGRDVSKVPKIIHHNQLDLATLVVMYHNFSNSKAGRTE